MKFEDALKAMRAGAKITSPFFEPDEYFQACKVGLLGMLPSDDLPISIVKMKGVYIHPDMGMGGSVEHIPKDFDKPPCKHGNFPQLNLLLVMRDDWEIVSD